VVAHDFIIEIGTFGHGRVLGVDGGVLAHRERAIRHGSTSLIGIPAFELGILAGARSGQIIGAIDAASVRLESDVIREGIEGRHLIAIESVLRGEGGVGGKRGAQIAIISRENINSGVAHGVNGLFRFRNIPLDGLENGIAFIDQNSGDDGTVMVD